MNGEDAIAIGDRLADICDLFGISDVDLDTARHHTDITKTVRQVTKLIYPNVDDRCKMRITTMDRKIIQAIIGKFDSPISYLEIASTNRMETNFAYSSRVLKITNVSLVSISNNDCRANSDIVCFSP